MEILKKLKKRIVPLVLAVVIFATSVVSGPASLTARAASVAVGEEFSVELAMLLYNIMETVAISSGIKDGLDDYESGSTLYDAFISYLDSAATPPYLRDTYITLVDGSSMTIQDAIEAANATVGSNALKLPEEEVFAKYRTISGGKNPENSPEPSSSPTPSGDDDYVVLDKFHEIAFILVSFPMLAMCTKFFEVVSQGEVEGVDPAEYYECGFSGNLRENDASHYVYDLSIVSAKTGVSYGQTYSVKDYDVFANFYGYKILIGILKDNPNTGILQLTVYGSQDFGYPPSKQIGLLSNAVNAGSTNYPVYYVLSNDSIETDIPLFSSIDDAKNYCLSGSLSGLLNYVPYDYHSMAAASSDTLKQLPSTKMDPNAIPALNNSMKKAANSVEATDTDKNKNNEAFISAVAAAVAAALAQLAPDSDPDPSVSPDPEPSAAPDPGIDTDYTGILGLILAAIKAISSGIWDFFCDPMGAITTDLTNLYNGVLRIIEIFPEHVQLVLGNIVSLPSAMLQAFADPLGAIQSLLGALPSWANLQGYLDKILDALVDPGSLLEPSNPGGEDPGGDGSGGGSKFNLLSLLNGLIYLIMILILLLKIFIHCLQFIINIFKIEASPGFLPDEMVMGLNFLKQIEITGIGLSIYDFMMGLVYILMVFGVVKLLRGYAYKIHIPSGGGK